MCIFIKIPMGAIPVTVSSQREALEPLIDIIGAVPLRELSAVNVRSALARRPGRGHGGAACA